MNESTKILHFSIGPVQGFVAQARRTRDLWAGSFLLSWLSGQAMAAVLENGGAIVFPAVGTKNDPQDELLKAILRKEHNNPHIGSLPNRFKAEVNSGFDPDIIKQKIMNKWDGLCNAVWQVFIKPIEKNGNETGKIWKRQVEAFWEIQWVLGQSTTKEDGRWLDIRKNWRNHLPTEEGGDHCVLMHDYQELSGFVRAQEKDKQDQFCKQLREELGLLDLREDERLCSIALVKRLFPKLEETKLKETIGWIPGEIREKTGNWPSTVYMAAVPWLEKFNDDKKINDLRDYVKFVEEKVEDKHSIKSERAAGIPSLKPLGDLASLDGNFFLETALNNHRSTPLSKTTSNSGDDPDKDTRETLLKKLKELNELVGEPASPYYALLLMDGDSLGKLLGRYVANDISNALSKFTSNVTKKVEENNGFTIYAGGDDVLAILPINTAIQCAICLNAAYTESFEDIKKKDENDFTASTAVLFSHYRNPLREVLHEAHHQLDDIAKDRNGRGSLALALLKPSGKAAEWCATWNAYEKNPPEILLELQKAIEPDVKPKAEQSTSQKGTEEKKFTTGFFYNLRQRYPMLINEQGERIIDEAHIKPILLAEYLKSREEKITEMKRDEAERNIDLLLDACYRYKRKESTPHVDKQSFQIGGVMLARFLAKGGIRE